VRRLREEFHASERRVCGLIGIPRMSCRYRSRRDDSVLRQRLIELAREKPRFGYRRLHILLCRDEPEARINAFGHEFWPSSSHLLWPTRYHKNR
jgi:hypothetical protein